MSYFEHEIKRARHEVFSSDNDPMPLDASNAFDLGLEVGFALAIRAYGIWRQGSQRIGASDKTIGECMAEFRAALKACYEGKADE